MKKLLSVLLLTTIVFTFCFSFALFADELLPVDESLDSDAMKALKEGYNEAISITIDDIEMHENNTFGLQFTYKSTTIPDSAVFLMPGTKDEYCTDYDTLYRAFGYYADTTCNYDKIGAMFWNNDNVAPILTYNQYGNFDDFRETVFRINSFVFEDGKIEDIMNRFQTLSTVTGTFDNNNKSYSFVMTDIDATAQELEISPTLLGYIFCFLNNYLPDMEFYNDEIVFSLNHNALTNNDTENTTTQAEQIDSIAQIDLSSSSTIIQIQEALNKAGYVCGTPDGSIGPMTADAIKAYETNHNLTPSGQISYELIELLGLTESLSKALTMDDFVFILNSGTEGEILFEPVNDTLRQIGTIDLYAFFYCCCGPGEDPENAFVTSRGIHTGDSKQAVIEAYGQGISGDADVHTFIPLTNVEYWGEDSAFYYQALNECVSFIKYYNPENTLGLYFFFDENEKLSWIFIESLYDFYHYFEGDPYHVRASGINAHTKPLL